MLFSGKHPSQPETIFFYDLNPAFQATDIEIYGLLATAVPCAQWTVISNDVPASME
jgi:hypothetical protein